MKRTKINIRRAIKECGYTVRDFAEKCGMTPANLSQIINGNPTVKKLGEICEVLGCDITDLFYPIVEDITTVDNFAKAEVNNSETNAKSTISGEKNTPVRDNTARLKVAITISKKVIDT